MFCVAALCRSRATRCNDAFCYCNVNLHNKFQVANFHNFFVVTLRHFDTSLLLAEYSRRTLHPTNATRSHISHFLLLGRLCKLPAALLLASVYLLSVWAPLPFLATVAGSCQPLLQRVACHIYCHSHKATLRQRCQRCQCVHTHTKQTATHLRMRVCALVIRAQLYLFLYAKFSTQFVVIRRHKLPHSAARFPPLKFMTQVICQVLTTTNGLLLAAVNFMWQVIAKVTQVIAHLRST